MAGIDDTIAALEAKLKQARARKQQLEARKRTAESKRQRADDTRRKILAGSLVLDMMAKDEQARARFTARLDSYLTHADDRALFGLDARKEAETPTSQASMSEQDYREAAA